MADLVIIPPGRQAPGFLRRMREGMRIMVAMRDQHLTAEVMDELVEFLLPYVAEPLDRQEARHALWEANQEQIEIAMASLSGGGDPLSAEANATE